MLCHPPVLVWRSTHNPVRRLSVRGVSCAFRHAPVASQKGVALALRTQARRILNRFLCSLRFESGRSAPDAPFVVGTDFALHPVGAASRHTRG